MKFLNRKKINKILSVLLLCFLVGGNTPIASAGLFGGPSIPSASSILSDMEKRYHLDTGSIQNQGESLNVADNKKPVPEVSLFFSPSDPRPGEKISARAFPMYFSTDQFNLYYTWYLRRDGCKLNNNPNAATQDLCDRDENSKITVEDWKIEAMKLLAQNNFDVADAGGYAADTDDDGYRAVAGGNNKVGAPNHCYINDPNSGKNYELLSVDADQVTFPCVGGTSPVCMVGEGEIEAENIDPLNPSSSFSFSDTDVCHAAGVPFCAGNGSVGCNVGVPRCVANPTTTTSCGVALAACNGNSTDDDDTVCRHLFPNAPGQKTGDGSFGVNEERFWGTNPNDPDTADNGNKDEANIAGLGQSTFTWNYLPGDQVGVAIEGTSMIATKYNDSSSMIMWAFPKKDCSPSLGSGTGERVKSIKGYNVTIPTVKMDLNKCIGYLDGKGEEHTPNLVDPTQGGQATNLELSVTASPDNPINDATEDQSGDVISAQVSISNLSRTASETLYKWEVEINNTPRFPATNITKDLQKYELLGNGQGIALDTLRLRMNIPDDGNKPLGGKRLSEYLDNGVGYLRFSVTGTESFSSGITRKGKSDVIVKFVSTSEKISAYKVDAVPVGDDTMHVALSKSLICNNDPLDRSACRVIKNEVIGLSVDPNGLSDFRWSINGAPLICTSANVSPDCEKNSNNNPSPGQQNHVNFFPVSGDPGDTYVVSMTANDLSSAKSDKSVTLTRAFHVVEPQLTIGSMNLNTAWPKLLGQYKDVNDKACPNGMCPEYSQSVLEGFSEEDMAFQGIFMPNFLADRATRQWTVDGTPVEEVAGVPGGAIAFAALKAAPNVYNIALEASVVQSQGIRQALRDIWDISPLDSPEIHFSTGAQIELLEPGFAQGTLQGTKKYMAAIASYVPASLLFLLRIVLAVFLLLFTVNILHGLLPERIVLRRE